MTTNGDTAPALSEEGRQTQFCIVCRQADVHPRHVYMDPGGQVQIMHLDCCRDSASCPDGSCHTILEHSGEKRYMELAAHIVENGDEIHALIAQTVNGNGGGAA
jgi:hypothetical protein